MCEMNLTAPMMTGRVNRTKTNPKECIELLRTEGFEVKESPVVPEAILCLKGNLAHFRCF